MTQPKALVFGSTASALITARQLEGLGYAVTIFDPGNHFQKDNPKFIVPDIPALPATEHFERELQNIARLAMSAVTLHKNDLSPLTWENGAFKSFLGFGEAKHKSIPAISRYNMNARLLPEPGLAVLLNDLLGRFQGEIHNFSEISKIECGGTQIKSVEINGAKSYTADLYVFAQTPREILQFLPPEILSQKDWSKLNRSSVWARVAVEVELPQTDLAAHDTLFLIPSSADYEPWLGQPGLPTSLWLSYLSEEKAEDPELIAGEIRNLKKTLTKVFTGLNESAKEPRIHVLTEAAASYSWLNSGEAFEKELVNALFISELLSDYAGLASSLDSASRAIERLQARTQGPTIQASDSPSLLQV